MKLIKIANPDNTTSSHATYEGVGSSIIVNEIVESFNTVVTNLSNLNLNPLEVSVEDVPSNTKTTLKDSRIAFRFMHVYNGKSDSLSSTISVEKNSFITPLNDEIEILSRESKGSFVIFMNMYFYSDTDNYLKILNTQFLNSFKENIKLYLGMGMTRREVEQLLQDEVDACLI